MLPKKRVAKVDENETDRINRKLVEKDDQTRDKRRPALGDVGNRVLRSQANVSKDGKLPDFKNVKPRVDTFWKKSDAVGKKYGIALDVPKKGALKVKVQQQNDISDIPVVPKWRSPREPAAAAPRAPLAAAESDFLEPDTSNSHSSELIENVVNIDENTSDNLMNMSEYVSDIYDYLYTMESKLTIQENYLAGHKDITARMRKILVDWINEVHCQFHLVNETYHMAVSLIDRYLQVSKNMPRKMLQLVGITALLVASKYEEVSPPSIHDFVHITDNSYSDYQVRQMEMSMLQKLNFNMGRPLAIHFLRRFSRAASATDVIHGAAKYFMELASVEYTMVHHLPSLMAAASIYLSLQIFDAYGGGDTWTPTLEYYTKYKVVDIENLTKMLAILVLKAPNGSSKAIYKKYKAKKNGEIAGKPEMSEGVILEIAEIQVQKIS